MEPQVVVDLLDLGRRDLQRRTQFGIIRILERNDGVEAVVAAVKFDDDEDGVLGPFLAERGGRQGGPVDETRNVQSPRHQAGDRRGSQKVAARGHGKSPERINPVGTREASTPDGTGCGRDGRRCPWPSSRPALCGPWTSCDSRATSCASPPG